MSDIHNDKEESWTDAVIPEEPEEIKMRLDEGACSVSLHSDIANYSLGCTIQCFWSFMWILLNTSQKDKEKTFLF